MFYVSKQAALLGSVVAVVLLTSVASITAAVASEPAAPAAPAPAVTVTVTADPLPAVTVTADPMPAVTVTETQTVTAPAPPAVTVTKSVTVEPAADETIGAGTWQVGADIPAGSYVTSVADGEHCSYARLSGLSGDPDDIIANGAYDGPAHGRITIATSDAGLELAGDCEWRKG